MLVNFKNRPGTKISDNLLSLADAAIEIPVEEPTKFELTANLTTARALKLAIPESFLALADKVRFWGLSGHGD